MLNKYYLKLIFIAIATNIIQIGLSETDFISKLIKENGFPVEVHRVWTKDDYGLTIHRIPPVMGHNGYPSVLLVHGMLSCGAQWIVNQNKSLAFMLSNAGYDTWILNARGTSLSERHKTIKSDDPKFWDYTFHEIGYYDVTASIDYILEVTQSQALHYIGYSQGTIAFLVGLSLHPEYSKKMLSAYLLHPAAYLQHISGRLSALFHVQTKIERFLKQHKTTLKNSTVLNALFFVCGRPTFATFCANLIMNMYGGNSEQVENSEWFIESLAKYVLDNGSTKQMKHLMQLSDSNRFQMYDYGPDLNEQVYNGSKAPLEYNISGIDVPVSVMYGTIDGLTVPKVSRFFFFAFLG